MASFMGSRLGLISKNGMSLLFKLQSIRTQGISGQKLVYSEYGEASVVVKIEADTLPALKPNEVIVRMLAAPVNPADINTIQGVYPVKPSLPAIPGNEGVGEIISVGSDVTNLKKGDRVLPGTAGCGTWRSHSVCDSKLMIKVPKNLGIVEAATLSVNPCTAYRMLKDFVPLKPGDTVIQNGANSAAGQYVIQLCKAWGLNSVNIVRDRDNIKELKDFLTELGATHVLTEEELRATDIFKKSLARPCLALNCVGGKNALQMLRYVANKGFMVTYGGMSRQPVTVPTSALIFKDVSILGFWMTRWTNENIDSVERTKMLNNVVELMIDGRLKAPVHKLVPFNDYKEALCNTMSIQGFSGLKYILDFQTECKN